MARETKDFKIEFKDVAEDGTFTGFAAVYGNVDLGGDVIDPGAFTKTIGDRGNARPILWQHKTDRPIGLGKLVDSPDGLVINGKLTLASPTAQEAYALLKDGVIKGLSIGYETIKEKMQGGVRYLKEVKLYEVSLVTMPMNELATVTGVKSAADEFEPAIAKFNEFLAGEVKAGRMLSAATMDRLRASHAAMQEAMGHLSALMSTSEDEAGKSAATLQTVAPDLHAKATSILELLRGN